MRTSLCKWAFMVLLVMVATACGGGSDTADTTNGTNTGSTNDLVALPEDTGGTHDAFLLGETTADYGFYLYVPDGYADSGPAYPLLVFLHGAGEKGNSQTGGLTTLNKVLVNGPPKLIQNHTWDPPAPMLVASPQCHDSGWNADKVHNFIQYLLSSYNVNEQRIYLTGLSMGGGGTFAYCLAKGQEALVAAAVPICGWGNPPNAANMKHIPVWAFHGDADTTVYPSGSINMIDAINATNPPTRALLTIYPGVAHNSWARTYDGTGMGTESPDYDPFDMSIYAWLLNYKRPLND